MRCVSVSVAELWSPLCGVGDGDGDRGVFVSEGTTQGNICVVLVLEEANV